MDWESQSTSREDRGRSPTTKLVPCGRLPSPRQVARKENRLEHTVGPSPFKSGLTPARHAPSPAHAKITQQYKNLPSPLVKSSPAGVPNMHMSLKHRVPSSPAQQRSPIRSASARTHHTVPAAWPETTPQKSYSLVVEPENDVLDLLDSVFARDAAFQKTRTIGLNKQLTRTKDGATESSRIQELAELVKILRRCVRLYQDKVVETQAKLVMHDSNTKHTIQQLVAKQAELRQTARDSASDLMVQVSKIQRDCDEQLRDQEFRISELKQQLSAEEAADLNGDHARKELEKVRKAYESRLDDQRMQMKNLEFASAQTKADFHAQVIKFQASINAEQSQVSSLERQLDNSSKQVEELQKQLKKSGSHRDEAEGKLKRLQQQSEQDLVQAKANGGELWKNLIQTREKYESEERVLKETLSKVTERAEAAEIRVQALKADWTALGSKAAQTDKELISVQARLVDADRQVEVYTSQLAEYTANQVMSASQIEELEQKLQEAELRVSNLIVELRAAAREAEAKNITCQQLETEVQDAKQREFALNRDRSRMKEGIDFIEKERQALDAEMVKATEELDMLKGVTIPSLQANLDLKTAQVAETLEQLREVHAKNMALQIASDEQSERMAEQSERMGEQKERLAVLESELEAMQDVIGCGESGLMVGQLVSKVATLESSLADTEKARRKMHNQLVELRGNIRVFCRMRPPTGSGCAAEALAGDGIRLMVDGKPNDFNFDRVFPPSKTQADVFNDVSDMVQSALDGYNVCLFSYGQTGSGKTFTMNGAPGCEALRGIIPRAVAQILAQTRKLNAAGWEFKLEACFIEIYNENLRDLLCEGGPRNSGRTLDANAIKHDPNAHTQVAGATKILVDSEATADEVIKRAGKSRSTDATAMNAESSRSHSVFTLHITATHEASNTNLLGSLNLVDLAGSERLDRSQAEGLRAKETCAINKSLSSLGDIFQALHSKSTHIPYRNSKLTYLLQPCLGGDGKTLMFVNINPEASSAFESLCSLRFAAKVNNVETSAKGGAKARVVSATSRVSSMPRMSSVPRPPSVGTTRGSSVAPGKRAAAPTKKKPEDSFRSSSLPATKRRK